MPAMPHRTTNELADLNSGGLVLAVPASTIRPILRVPFEAYITITRDASTPETLTPEPQVTSSSSVSGRNQKFSSKVRDSDHEASTSGLPGTLSPGQRSKSSKKGKDSSRYNFLL